MIFQIVESVVYPPYGIAVIANITRHYFGSEPELCYHLRICSNAMRAIVPLNRAGDVGLRRVAKQADVKRVLAFLANETCTTSDDWKTRSRDNAVRLHTGDLLEAAEVLKGLALIREKKPLSSGEKQTFEAARRLMVNEISAAHNINEEGAVALIERAVRRALLSRARAKGLKPRRKRAPVPVLTCISRRRRLG